MELDGLILTYEGMERVGYDHIINIQTFSMNYSVVLAFVHS